MRPSSVVFFLSLSLLACSSSGVTAPAQTNPSTDAAGDAPADDGPLDPTNDPVPTDIGDLGAHATASGSDVAPDLSCAGTAMPVMRGTDKEREFHLVALGGTDADRVGDVPVELLLANKPGKADMNVMAPKDDDKTKNGVFKAKTHGGFIAYRIAPVTGFVGILGLDLEVPEDGPVLPAIPPQSNVDALSALIGGADYTPKAGDGRVVLRVVDCNVNPLVNTHVTLEVDGKVIAPATGGVLRSYFSDSELPGDGHLTSRSGVVVFLDVPGTATSVRAVARAKVGGAVKVVGMRSIPLVANGITTAKITPWQAP